MTYLLRLDFNVENTKDALRFQKSLTTIRQLLKGGSRVLILSHRGRPKGFEKKLSLRFALPFLKNGLKQPIIFLDKIPSHLPEKGRVFLLENLRFWSGEEKNDLAFAKKLAKLGDRYVNDAFAVSHRKNASITQLPKLLPSSIGPLLKKEVETLTMAMKNPKKPLILIFGGAKLDDKMPVIRNLMPKITKVLFGSGFVNSPRIVPKSSKIIIPVDWIGERGKALDIGPLTLDIFKREIQKAKTIIWNGPVGLFENKKYANGSIALAKIIAKSPAFTIVGGGETTRLILQLGLEKKIGFLSTGGGAMLELLAGKKLPGIEALK